jgi:hypothetical protein
VGLDFSPHVLNGDEALKDVQRAVFAVQARAAPRGGRCSAPLALRCTSPRPLPARAHTNCLKPDLT